MSTRTQSRKTSTTVISSAERTFAWIQSLDPFRDMDNRGLLAICIVLSSVLGKHINVEISPRLKKAINSYAMQKVMLFIAAFLSTKDVVLSLIAVLIITLLFDVLLNEKCAFSII